MFDASTTFEIPKSHNLQNYSNNLFIQNFLFIQGHPKYLPETQKHRSDTCEHTEGEVHWDICSM